MIKENKKILTITGLLVLAVVGSAMWDVVVRPGITGLGGFMTGILTFSITKAVDASYTSAALNPYPISSLVLLVILGSCGACSFFSLCWVVLTHSVLRKEKLCRISSSITESLFVRKFSKYVLQPIIVLLGIYGGLMILASLLVVNHAVLTRRIFEANLKIIVPFTPEEDVQSIRADFARVRGKEDFILVYERMRSIAEENSVELRKEKLW